MISDALVIIGLAIIGAALWLAVGWVALLGYVGTVALVVGLVLAWQQRQGNG